MARSWKYILLSLWFYYLIFASIFLFLRGFLLRRDALTEKAECILPVGVGRNTPDKNISITSGKSSLSSGDSVGEAVAPSAEPTTKKVILMVVDALKYEFIMYNESLNESQSQAYQNKIPVVHELLKRKPHNTRVYKFIADPPTTTMQRLKGITTGSLPTFIDVGSNFATSEINEDNVIDQLVGLNLSVVFMGDDTWTALYPRRFLREFSYPSFNVWDLDTVDNGVMFHLIPEILKNDWKLLIAHVLGVDHCGHKYGPYHPEMSRKLKEVNANIRKVIDVMDEDTVLFVLGDHGMTSTGDHGGDSVDEVTAGLFVYSPTPLFPKDIVEESDTISQVDLVPTLSLILGIPIPFSNVGRLTVGSIPYRGGGGGDAPAWKYILMALWANAYQVNRYLSLYSQISRQLPPEKLQIIHETYVRLSEHIVQVSTAQEFKIISKGIKEYLLLARNMCAEIWVQFDSILMTSGLCFMLLFVFCLLIVVDGVPLDEIQIMISNGCILALVCGLAISLCCCYILHIFHIVENIDIAVCSMTCFLSVFFIIAIIIMNRRISINLVIAKIKFNDCISMSTRIIFSISLIGQFSNSYVIEDSTVLSFCLTSFSVIVLYFSSSAKDVIKQRYDKNRALYSGTPFKKTTMLVAVLFSVVTRVSHYYWRCREEQNWCDTSEWIKSASFTEPSHYGLHSFYALIYLALLVTIFRMWLRSSGNLVGFSINIAIVRYVPTVVAICMSAFWILQGLPKNTKYSLTPWQIHMWPCVIFFLLGVSVVRFYIYPLSIYRLPKTKLSMEGVYGQDSIIPHIFSQIRESLERRNRAQVSNPIKDFPVVYGLATVYSAAVIIFSLFTLLLISLLLGNHLAPSAALMFMASMLVLTLQAMLQHDRILLANQLFSVPWVSIVWWCLLSSYFFYATGHHPTFPSIQWDAAFVGGFIISTHVVPALLVGLNTFASQLWFSVSLPLVLIFPFTLIVMFPKKDDRGSDLRRGELILYEKEEVFHHCMFILCSKYVLLHGLRVFSCMLAAAIHCRHLMVWKIFAPKLIFESLGLFVTMVGTLMGYILVLRVTKTLKVLMRTFE